MKKRLDPEGTAYLAIVVTVRIPDWSKPFLASRLTRCKLQAALATISVLRPMYIVDKDMLRWFTSCYYYELNTPICMLASATVKTIKTIHASVLDIAQRYGDDQRILVWGIGRDTVRRQMLS